MPAAPRPNNKATKIAWNVLGKPAPLQKTKKTKQEDKLRERLIFEETTRVR